MALTPGMLDEEDLDMKVSVDLFLKSRGRSNVCGKSGKYFTGAHSRTFNWQDIDIRQACTISLDQYKDKKCPAIQIELILSPNYCLESGIDCAAS
jgi:hypothetical protein